MQTRTLAGAALAMLAIVLAGCGENARARSYHHDAFSDARHTERDPAKQVALLRSFADGLERNPAAFFARERARGGRPGDDIRTRPNAFVAEWRARAAAIEANPHLYAQTLRCSADIVAERFELEGRARGGPQWECGHCVGSPSCPPWRP